MRLQKRTGSIALLLALSLVFSGIPVTPAYASEILEPEEAVESERTAEPEEAVEPEETAEPEETVGSEETAEPEEILESKETVLQENSASMPEKNVKMAGSDGVFYDDVLYLSAGNVMAMSEKLQARYRRRCDEIAAIKNNGVEVKNAVFAVDADGGLHCSYSVSMRGLDVISAEMSPDLEDAPILNLETKGADLLSDITTEKKDESNLDEGKDTAKEKDETTSDEGEDTAEEKDETKELTVFEENMDKISSPQAETFDVIEPVRLTDMIDLGYGGFSAGSRQAYSLLPSEDYYRNQLTDIQKMLYDAAKDTLIKGTNQFTVTVQDSSEIGWDDMIHAVSALMLAYPAETDWMKYCPHRSYSMQCGDDSSGMTEEVVVTIGISDYYSSSLEQQAQEKVKEAVQLAVQYAMENYPDVLTYGVVRYLDQWVCENGYFAEDKGGVDAYYRLVEAGDDADDALREAYYKCHTAYGILLEGYGVCEGYAKTMSRLLDAVGIPNLFVPGDWMKGGNAYGHAWNYVLMPNGSWYLLDSTYNDASGPPSHKKSTMQYLLVKNNGQYQPSGDVLLWGNVKFNFPTLADSNYDAGSEYDVDSDYGDGNGTITLSQTECSLVPKGRETLTYTIDGDWDYRGVSCVWSSSDTKVAKVDKNGVVTAVAPGTATIFLTASGMAAECKINVDQVKALKSESTGKNSESVSLGIDGEKKEEKTIALTVDMGKSPHTAEWMVQQGKISAPQAVCSKSIVTVTKPSVSENRITLTLRAVSPGNANVSVKFAGKTVTLKVAAGQLITEEMFDITWPSSVREESGKMTTSYTGKAVRPVVRKKPDVQYRPVTFKITYVHNKDAGSARVLVTGSGKYGGTIEYPFVITPIDITSADFSGSLKSKAYNGGANPPTTVVKLNGKALKVNRDYEILYNKERESEIKAKNGGAIPVGSYTITINGKGNYTGTVSQSQEYRVTPNTIAKVSVSGAGSAKYTGVAMKPYTVKIGRNVLPDTDYKITWYRGQGQKRNASPMKTAPTARGRFTAVITVEGDNLTVTDRKKEIVKNFTIK